MNRYHTPSHSVRLYVEELDCRDTPAVTGYQVFGAAPGGLPLVSVVNSSGTQIAQFQPFESSFHGGVHATLAELDGDPNTVSVVAAAGPGGGPHVAVYRIDLANNNAVTQVASFDAFEPSFTGGVRVAAGNIGADGTIQDIIVAPDTGGAPRVRVFQVSGATATPISGPLGDFYAYEPSFTGGVRVAAGELDGNLQDGNELVVGAGLGGGPRVQVFRADGAVLANYYAYDPNYRGGANVSVDTSTTIGHVLVDTSVADPSQQNAALNQAAGVSTTSGGGSSGTGTGSASAASQSTSLLNGSSLSSNGATTGTTTGGTNSLGAGGTTATGTSGTGATATGTGGSLGTTGTTGTGTAAAVGSTGTGTGTSGTTGTNPYGDPGAQNPFPGLSSPPFTGQYASLNTTQGTTGTGSTGTSNTGTVGGGTTSQPSGTGGDTGTGTPTGTSGNTAGTGGTSLSPTGNTTGTTGNSTGSTGTTSIAPTTGLTGSGSTAPATGVTGSGSIPTTGGTTGATGTPLGGSGTAGITGTTSTTGTTGSGSINPTANPTGTTTSF